MSCVGDLNRQQKWEARSTWMAPWVKRPTRDFCSGHDLRVVRLSPAGLHTQQSRLQASLSSVVAAHQACTPLCLQHFISSSGSLLEAGAVLPHFTDGAEPPACRPRAPHTERSGDFAVSQLRARPGSVVECLVLGQSHLRKALPCPVHGVAGLIVIPAGLSPRASACLCNALSSLYPWQSPLPSPILQPQGHTPSG